MRTDNIDAAIRATAATMLLAALLAGCAGPVPEAAAPPPAAAAVPDAPPATGTLPARDATPTAPPSTEPSVAPKLSASNEPTLESMHAAKPSAKMSVAVSLRYSFEGAVLPDQPVTLHLAAVPRAEGTNLKVSMRQAEGVALAEGSPSLQKIGSSTVYRQQVSVTKLAGAPSELRVLVTMNMGSDLAFGTFTIPLDGGTNAQKQDSIKQR